MNLLLDTHVLLWWLAGSHRLRSPVRALITSSPRVYVSAATAWEIAIKRSLGKLEAPQDLEAALADSHFLPLSVSIQHALAAGALPHHHDDPFDRMLIAQAREEGLRLLTGDERLRAYGQDVVLCRDVR